MIFSHIQYYNIYPHEGKRTDLGSVTSFKYLGAVVSGDGSKPEILSRIAQATADLATVPNSNFRCSYMPSEIRFHKLVSFILLWVSGIVYLF